ncbi:hypothetical protein HNP46_002181 [Pseudomonas nitritireducens]|uniref:Uncharacterized protein n=1 Tax=Pseudomonas nitroreducens TaxID=46680 RepID=A0A7W7KJ66_PSENT|nr:hypothetical protein [Pseudomonas nitritireducens]MBB4863334.1 hypothetical protein [Pseudomonas nitritireducens]
MGTKQVETGRFQARGESGQTFTVIESTTIVQTQFMDGSQDVVHGSKGYRVVGGGPLNRISENEFEIAATGEVLTRI